MNADIQILTANISTSEQEISNLQQEVRILSRGIDPDKLSEADEESNEISQFSAENLKLKHRLSILNRAIRLEEIKSSPTMQQGGSIQDILYDLFKSAISDAFANLPDAPVVIALSGNNPSFGDYQLNSAMQIANILKQRGEKIAPRDIANKILQNTQPSPLIEKMEVAGAGFINIWLSRSYGRDKLNNMLREGILPPVIGKKSKIVVDFSSPNIAKEMHVGHLRSTIIGESISRVLEFLGHSVLRVNHIGDWGTQFGMLIAHLQDEFPDYLAKAPPISDLQTFYKGSKKRFDEDEVFKKRAYDCVVKLQGFDENYVKAWQMICDVSRNEFQNIYDRLNISLIERGESFYQTRMNTIVAQLKSQDLLEEDEGRQIMWPTTDQANRNIPMTIVKSDGGYTYDTSDMATIKQRIEEEQANWLIYVTDMGQATHFELLFGCAKRAGVLREAEVRVDHVGFGVVLGENKKKLKTRSGKTVRLCDLLDEGVKRSLDKLREKNREKELSQDEITRASEAIAYGCIKYADLSHNRNAEYVFSFDKMLEDKGNTAVYLLYALTRIRSIARNAKMETSYTADKETTLAHSVNVSHEKEWKLGKVLLRFPVVLRKVASDLYMHHLCEYVYEVATTFTEFYDACYCIERDTDGKIVKIHEGRLQLVELTAQMIERCLGLLGISTVDKIRVRMSNITFPTKNKSLTSVHSQQISSNQVMEKPREKVFYRKVSFAESQTTMTDGRKERQRPRSRSVYTNKSHNSDTSGSIRDVLKYDSVAPWIARSLSNKNLYMDDYHHDYYHDEGGHGGGNTMPPLSMGPHPHAHSHHHHMSQQQQQYQHGASITSQGNVVLRLQDRVRVEISLEKAVRVVNMRSGIVLALSATGSSAALIHPNGRVYQYGSRVEILANDSQGNNKYAKMWYKGVSFTSDQCALVYLVDSAGTRTTTDTFSDLSGDFSVSVFYNDGPYSEPHHIVSSQALFNEAVAVLQTSNHWVSEDGTNNWLINSVRVSQTLDGLVRVGRSSNKFSLRTSPSNGSASVSSPFLHCTGSMGQTRHLFVRRGERRMHYDGASFIVRNAGHSAGFDDKHQLKVY